MNTIDNVIHVNFSQRSSKSIAEKAKWDRVHHLDKLISQKLTIDQLTRLMGTSKYIDRAYKVRAISQSKAIHKYAAEMVDLINEINLETNTIGKVYTMADVPF